LGLGRRDRARSEPGLKLVSTALVFAKSGINFELGSSYLRQRHPLRRRGTRVSRVTCREQSQTRLLTALRCGFNFGPSATLPAGRRI
jgi:hypothetical protein